jgi:ribonuclease HI
VVWQGRTPGIYDNWNACKAQVDKFAGARYKSFKTQAEAQAAFNGGTSTKPSSSVKKAASKSSSVRTYTGSEIDKMTYATKIFTDGGCEPNPGEAGSGIAVYRDGQLDQLWYGLYNPMGTNNTAELNALHQALLMAEVDAELGRTVAIFCDSKYAIQCITQWAAGWQKKGWKKSGGEIKNLELIQQMFALYMDAVESNDGIEIYHVNGHVGVEGNELADRMSIYAINQKTPSFDLYDGPLNVPEVLAMSHG